MRGKIRLPLTCPGGIAVERQRAVVIGRQDLAAVRASVAVGTRCQRGAAFDGSVFDVYLLLVTHQQVLAAKDRATKRLLGALVLAEEWARTNPGQAKDLIVRRFNLQPEALNEQWRRMQLAVILPQDLLVTMDGQPRWLAKRDGRNPEDIPDYSRFVASAALRDVKPSAVTLFTEPGAAMRFRRPAAVATR
jgi:hypothetical protein